MDVFAKAVEANVPIISVQTTDVVNAMLIIGSITGKKPKSFKVQDQLSNKIPPKGSLQVQFGGKVDDSFVRENYDKMVEQEATLVVVNPEKVLTSIFDAGTLPTPRKVIFDHMMEICGDKEEADDLTMALGGTTLREAIEICRMTMAETHSLTPKGIGRTRRDMFLGSQGLYPVDTTSTFYLPSEELSDYVEGEKEHFFDPQDPRFQPRGLLLDGPPGTGKSSAAKWIADQWGIPLYRLSIGDAKNKYVGESEGNLRAALSSLDAQAPCVVLFDEVEKVFGGVVGADSGTTTGMLSSVLWWLAEHKSKVLAVMTTNNRQIIPPELYRPGRLDGVMYLGGLEKGAAEAFAVNVGRDFKVKFSQKQLDFIVNAAFSNNPLKTDPPTVAHSTVQHYATLTIKQSKKAKS